MKDKERILTCIISRVIPGLYIARNDEKKKEYYDPISCFSEYPKKGDLVLAITCIKPNKFTIGFMDHFDYEKGCHVIREIGSDRLCDYYNERFSVIKKEHLGFEILEGVQYKTYQKVLKAFEYTGYATRFKDISFEGEKCTVQGRIMFENDPIFEITFKYDKKTTIKQIGEMLKKADEERKKR